MKIYQNILIVSLILAVVCFVGCKRKTEPAKADLPKGEVSLKAEGKSAEPNIVQEAKVKKKIGKIWAIQGASYPLGKVKGCDRF